MYSQSHVYIPVLIFMMMIKDMGQAIIIIVLASTVLLFLFPRWFVFVELVCFPSSVVCVFLPPLPFIKWSFIMVFEYQYEYTRVLGFYPCPIWGNVKCESFFFTARSQRMRYETRGLETTRRTPTVYRLCVTPRVSKVSQYIVDIKLHSRVTAHMTPRRIHPSYLLITHAHYKW